MKQRVYLAIDIGASNGRAIAGYLTPGGTLQMQEIYRFSNGFVRTAGGLCWDHNHIYREILQALRECRRLELDLACIGIDAWSQDYAWVDDQGQILAPPRCYRDPILDLHADDVDPLLGDAQAFWRVCGQRKSRISTMRQLYYDCTHQPALVERARYFLFIPYLFVYFLTGQAAYDTSLPAIGEMADVSSGEIRRETAALLGMEEKIPPCYPLGRIIGRTNATVRAETGYDAIPVACVNAHDTNSAVLAIGSGEDYLFLSSGTWSMYGAVVERPMLEEAVYDAGLCNSPLGDGRTALMGGTAGMYVIQQCMGRWNGAGETVSYAELTEYALRRHSDAWFRFEDIPDTAEDMPAAVARAVEQAGFRPPENPFALYEIFANSLARLSAEDLLRTERAVGRRFPRVYLVGGGAKAAAVNERIAAASGKQICTGITEAAVAGNLLAQLLAMGELDGFSQLREVSRRSFPSQTT